MFSPPTRMKSLSGEEGSSPDPVDRTEVPPSRSQPSAVNASALASGWVEITTRDRRALHLDLTDGTGAERHPVSGADAQMIARLGTAVGGQPPVERIVREPHRELPGCLGHAVDVRDARDAELVVQALQILARAEIVRDLSSSRACAARARRPAPARRGSRSCVRHRNARARSCRESARGPTPTSHRANSRRRGRR